MNAKSRSINKMNLKDMVCDKEYSVKLKGLGLRISSLLFHNVITDEIVLNDDCNNYINVRVYTPTVAELGEMMPSDIMRGDSLYYFTSQQVDDWFECWYAESIDKGFFITKHDQKEANARAKLLIWLIENKHANVEDLNNG
jgi:hypothetical protein